MGEAIAVTIAKEVTEDIRYAQLSMEGFTLTRSYAEWDLDLKETEGLYLREAEKLFVDVVSHTTEQEAELSARNTLRYTVPIDIAVRKKFESEQKDTQTGRIKVEEIDKLMLLTQELHVLFTPQRLTNFRSAVWDGEKGGTRIIAAPIKEHLRQLRQFTSILRIYFRADVALTHG